MSALRAAIIAALAGGPTAAFAAIAAGGSYELAGSAISAGTGLSQGGSNTAQVMSGDWNAGSSGASYVQHSGYLYGFLQMAGLVSISAPTDGATVSGAVLISAVTANDAAVIRVEFYVDGALKVCSTSASPYGCSWDTLSASNGAHSLVAKVYDAAGAVTMSDPVSVTVSNNAAPGSGGSVAFASPADGATVQGSIGVVTDAPLTAAAAAGAAPQVKFFVDGVVVATAAAAPYAFTWDSRSVVNGTHTLTAQAFAGALPGAQGRITVTVANSPMSRQWSLSQTVLSTAGITLGNLSAQAAQVVVPPGAVAQQAVLTISAEDAVALPRRSQDAQARGLTPLGKGVDVSVIAFAGGREPGALAAPSLTLSKPIALRLAYDPAQMPSGAILGLFFWDDSAQRWRVVPGAAVDPQSSSVAANVAPSQPTTYALFAVAPLNAAGALQLGEIFAYPNPSRGGRATIHVESIPVDSLEIKIYDLRGALVRRATLYGAPSLGVNGKQAYEYVWDTAGVAAGAYIYVVEANRGGTARSMGKLAVIH